MIILYLTPEPFVPMHRITVTLPAELIGDIDRREQNRSRFVLEAVRRELARRRREELRRSIRTPHPEAEQLAAEEVEAWNAGLPDEREALTDPRAGRPVRWVPGKGWLEP